MFSTPGAQDAPRPSSWAVRGLRSAPAGAKELFKNNLYILLVFSPDSTRGKSLT